jgi:hypothetical protein
MVGDPGRIKRVINGYVSRRLQPVQTRVDQTAESVEELRRELERTREQLAQALEEVRGRLDAESDRSAVTLSTVNMVARRTHRPDRIRCLFLIHYMEAWDGLADVVELMRAAPDFEPIVASIPRRLPASDWFRDEEISHRRLEASGVPHIRLYGDSQLALDTIRQLDPDLIFRQSQWEADVPPGFSAENLGSARLALIPYEVFNTIENVRLPGSVRDSATDSWYHRNCWAVFCANEMVKARADAMSPATRASQYVVTGHPKVARIRRALEAAPAPADRPFTVMWSAHHSIGDHWTKFGLFPVIWPQMVQWARERPEWHFVFSPHPSLLTVMEAADPPLSPESVAQFWEQWNALPNTEFDPGGQDGTYGALFARSDVCVSDGISMLVEFQIANKPVIHVAREGHVAFNDIGQICQRGWHTVTSVEAAKGLVAGFAAGEPDPLAQAQMEVVAQVFEDHDAAREIVDYIRDNWDSR